VQLETRALLHPSTLQKHNQKSTAQVEAEMAKRGGGPPPAHPLDPEEQQHAAHIEHLRQRACAVFDGLDVEGRGALDR